MNEIAKYMKLPVFLDLVQRRALALLHLSVFEDKWEGRASREELEMRLKQIVQTPDVPPIFSDLLVESAKKCFVWASSWTVFVNENARMWDSYAGEYGVLIKSRRKNLERAIDSFSPKDAGLKLFFDQAPLCKGVGDVIYTRDIPHENPFYLIKRPEFETEREVRVYLSTSPTDNQPLVLFCPVETNALIEKVVVSPRAPTWFVETVEAISRRFGLNAEVSQSRLLEPFPD